MEVHMIYCKMNKTFKRWNALGRTGKKEPQPVDEDTLVELAEAVR